MPLLLSTEQVAEQLCHGLGVSNIDKGKVLALVQAGGLTDVGPGRSVRVAHDQCVRFLQRTRYVRAIDWPVDALYRVSLLAIRPDPVTDSRGRLIRSHAGADLGNAAGLSPKQRRRAWTGMWWVHDDLAQEAVARRAVIFGTVKGYVSPDYVREIVGYSRSAEGQLRWKTRPASSTVSNFVATGLWQDVSPGAQNAWVKR